MPNIFTAGYHSPQHIFLLQILMALMAVRVKMGLINLLEQKTNILRKFLISLGSFLSPFKCTENPRRFAS